jgi:hypothetical protein
MSSWATVSFSRRTLQHKLLIWYTSLRFNTLKYSFRGLCYDTVSSLTVERRMVGLVNDDLEATWPNRGTIPGIFLEG